MPGSTILSESLSGLRSYSVKTMKWPLSEKDEEEDLITQAYLGYYENQKKDIVEIWLSRWLTNKTKFETFSVFFELWEKDHLHCAQLLSALRRYTIVHHRNHHLSRDNIAEVIQLLCTNKLFLEPENMNKFVEYYSGIQSPESRIAYLILCFEVGMEAKRNGFVNRAIEIFELLHCCEAERLMFSTDLDKVKKEPIKHPLVIFSSVIPTLELQYNLCVSQKGIGISKMKWFNFLREKSIGFPKEMNMCEDYLAYILEIKTRNKIGLDTATDIGLLIESLFIFPFALITFYFIAKSGSNDFNLSNLPLSIFLILAGPMTVIPLFLYVRGVELIGLGPTGMIFYITPTLQFILGYFYYNEVFSIIKFISFIIIWIAVVIYLKDLYETN